jgi:hypothetical protein
MLVSALSAKVHVGALPLHPPPCQPAKTMEASGVTASLIDVLEANDAEQPVLLPVRQEMPAGVLTTAPVPFPAKASVSSKLLAGGVAGVPIGLGFPVLVAFETPPHEIRIAHAGTNIASEITERKENLFRTRHSDQNGLRQNGLREKRLSGFGRNRSD